MPWVLKQVNSNVIIWWWSSGDDLWFDWLYHSFSSFVTMVVVVVGHHEGIAGWVVITPSCYDDTRVCDGYVADAPSDDTSDASPASNHVSFPIWYCRVVANVCAMPSHSMALAWAIVLVMYLYPLMQGHYGLPSSLDAGALT